MNDLRPIDGNGHVPDESAPGSDESAPAMLTMADVMFELGRLSATLDQVTRIVERLAA